MTTPSVDLDQIEALAKAAMPRRKSGKWFSTPVYSDEHNFVEAISPAVILQWVAETRAVKQNRDALFVLTVQQDDKLRVAVEALKKADLHLARDAQYIDLKERRLAQTVIATALATLSGHAGGQGEGEK